MSRLELKNIRKDFDERRVLAGVTCSLDNGVIALLGENGAGKSTLLHILSTHLKSSSGHFILDGLHSVRDAQEIRRKIGLIGHKSFLYRQMSVYENLSFYAQLYGLEKPQERIEELAQRFEMQKRLQSKVGELSRGLLQRASIMRALLHDPELLLFDEPFTGLDQHSAELFLEQIQALRDSSRLIIITTHDFQRAAIVASRFLFLKRGKLKEDISQELTADEIQRTIAKLL